MRAYRGERALARGRIPIAEARARERVLCHCGESRSQVGFGTTGREGLTTETLLEKEKIDRRVCELAEELSRDFMGRNPVLVGILKGSAVFLTDLMRKMSIDCEVDFLSVSSYGDRTESSGSIKLLKDLDRDIFERDVIVVEDIIDSGYSLAYIRRYLAARNPRSLSIVALLDKRDRRQAHVYVDYVGFTIPDRFVVGYGLDFAERFRGLSFIGVLDEKEIEAVRSQAES